MAEGLRSTANAGASGPEPTASAGPGGAKAAGAEERPFKRILLFSDGTGNSSASLMKTNVWRMYEMVDLGPAPEGEVVQIGFYSNGVGTSNFEPLAALGGVFGIGLKRNVLTLYEFLCRTYEPGDEILAFGFSRGAFTIRLLVHLIATQGVVKFDQNTSEAALRRQSREAYRRMYADWRLNSPLANAIRTGLLSATGALRRGLSRLRGMPLDLNCWQDPRITFVGLWDTVAAYGGPIVEITRGIDDWIWPLTMPDYRLSKKVLCARHALALDDKRNSFHPLVWDETVEDDRDSPSPRLQQVWFTGMHADVGGGYPDDSLSYVSLTWMIEELGDRARLLDTAVARAYDLANDYGPMHDSRQGIGSYYRYQPRRIEAYLDPPTARTLGLRDPNVRKRDGDTRKWRLQGLIHQPLIHESVFRRLLDGTDGYAPIALPRRLKLVRRRAETRHADLLPPLPSALQADLDRLADDADTARQTGFADPLDEVWNVVWARRVAYFLTVFLTLFLVLFPSQQDDTCGVLGCGDDRWWLSPFTGAAKSLLPGITHGWIDAWSKSPAWFLTFALVIIVAMRVGARLERGISDRTRRVWSTAVRRIARATDEGRSRMPVPATEAVSPPDIERRVPKWWSRARESRLYQRFLQRFKWRWVPRLVGPGLVLLANLAVLSLVTQLRILWLEDTNAFCQTAQHAPVGSTAEEGKSWLYTAYSACTPTDYAMIADHEYEIRFRMLPQGGPWRDIGPTGTGPQASIAGVDPSDESWVMTAGIPIKRVVGARYLQPMLILRAPGFQRPYVAKLDLVDRGRNGFVARFRAPVDGVVALFANDAVPPWPLRHDLFYARNKGEAGVTICEVGVTCPEYRRRPRQD